MTEKFCLLICQGEVDLISRFPDLSSDHRPKPNYYYSVTHGGEQSLVDLFTRNI